MLNEKILAFARSRGISGATLGRLRVDYGITFFPALEHKAEAIFFGYQKGWKARPLDQKTFVSGGGFVLAFWNIEAVMAGPLDTIYLTEGELDACALVEAGIDPTCVLSVPNGAKERKPGEPPKDVAGFGYVLDTIQAGLGRAKKFVWAGDTDAPGLALREDMSMLFGIARFHFINWPEGIKDANDLLIKDGPAALHGLVTEGALPWPAKGLYRAWELPDPAPMTLWSTGFPAFDSRVMLASRTLSVVTGQPGHGKTQLFGQIWHAVVERYGLIACIASFETDAKPHYIRQLRTLQAHRLECQMTDTDIHMADKWIGDHYVFLQHPERMPDLQWFIDMAEVAVERHGARIIQLDPWNRLEATRGQDSETDHIGRCLRELYNFAKNRNVHVQIIAHPAKMDGPRKRHAPFLEDISGSKNWDNMPDQGFTVHRQDIFDEKGRRTEADLYHRKARFPELGYPCRLPLNFNLAKWRYEERDTETPETDEEGDSYTDD